MTSTTMMVRCLISMGAVVRYDSHRFRDGYGLSYNVLDFLKAEHCGLLITRCGITCR